MREMYPSLARSVHNRENEDLSRTETADDTNALTLTSTIDQEAEDIDLSALAEEISPSQEQGARPANLRQMTSSTVSTTNSFEYEVNPVNLGPGGKWAPPHARTSAQQWRYIRRCMPTLLYDAPRATPIIICHGRRLRINVKMDMLEEWELAPPSYDAHAFPEGLDRTFTMASSLATTTSTISASSVETQDGKATSAAPQNSKTRPAEADRKRLRHETPASRTKLPERTLMEEGIVVVAF